MIRQMYARQFYEGDCSAMMNEYAGNFVPPDIPSPIVAGIVPHAGWFFSGATAAKVFLTIKANSAPQTFIILGAVHTHGGDGLGIYRQGAWETPLGRIDIDEALVGVLIDEMKDLLVEDYRIHSREHSIEVQTPMIKALFPDARIIPIAVPPVDEAAEFGGRLARVLRDIKKDVVVIGSTDLTHYGDNYGFSPAGYGNQAHSWMKKNDERIIRLAVSMSADDIVPEAAENMNACGAGAMAATVAAAKTMGKDRGYLLEYTTSYDVYRQGAFEMGVGYAGIVF